MVIGRSKRETCSEPVVLGVVLAPKCIPTLSIPALKYVSALGIAPHFVNSGEVTCKRVVTSSRSLKVSETHRGEVDFGSFTDILLIFCESTPVQLKSRNLQVRK